MKNQKRLAVSPRGVSVGHGWRLDKNTHRGLPFTPDYVLRTPRTLRSHTMLTTTSVRPAEPVRDAALWVGLACIAISLLLAGFTS